MKRSLSLLLVILLALSLTACGVFGSSRGELHVSAGGERYATVARCVRDEGEFSPQELKEQVTQIIPYSSGITLNLDGDYIGDICYSLYDGQLNEFYTGKTALEIPVATGTYYCVVEIKWGDEVYSELTQHAFCFARSE